jgi:hypothetical protein
MGWWAGVLLAAGVNISGAALAQATMPTRTANNRLGI